MIEKMDRYEITSDTPWWRRPSFEYMVELDKYCTSLEAELEKKNVQHEADLEKKDKYISKLREELAKSGNAYYIAEARKAMKQHKDLLRRLAENEAKVTQLTMDNNYLRARCELYEKSLTQEHKAQRLPNGRYYSDMSKAEKCKMAYDLECEGWKHEQIAEDLGIQYDSVRKYIAEHKKTIEQADEKITYWWEKRTEE